MFKAILRERRRTAAVNKLKMLNTAAEPSFDRFVQLAAHSFDAPIALLSLIHGEEQWFKATHGMPIRCLPKNQGFCRFTLDSPNLVEVCDATRDDRFCRLPAVVGEPHARYYIGAALRLMNGMEVGALCVLDTVPRRPASSDQGAYLAGLARQAAVALETRAAMFGNRTAA